MSSTGRARELLLGGLVIPGLPLALTASRRFDEGRERVLLRYYLEAGAGGLAVGVHSTQFGIHDPRVGLYKPVLQLAAEEIRRHEENGSRVLKVAGLAGPPRNCLEEARLAVELGYDCALLSPSGEAGASDDGLLECARAVSEVLPLFGFYLQTAVGGRVLGYDFWRSFLEIEDVVAIKIAPFNRYQTLDVARAVAESGRAGEVALYTGNDDNILIDLLTTYEFKVQERIVRVRMRGGLLGQWGVWTRRAVEMFQESRPLVLAGAGVPDRLLTLAAKLTDANAAIFDVRNQFRGCIAGVLEALRRRGLLTSTQTLEDTPGLSPGQSAEIERVERAYPELLDNDFVDSNLHRWLSP